MGQKMNKVLSDVKKVQGWSQPILFDLNKSSDLEELASLKSSGAVQQVSDNIEAAFEELYHIENPGEIDEVDGEKYDQFIASFGQDHDQYGSWVFYPWSGTLVHFPEEEHLRQLRGSRNRNLITEKERKSLVNNKTILILGLSVGSNAVDSLLLQGIGSRYILVDMDHLSPTNLNRIRSSYDQLGVHKVDITAKRISELDPYLDQIHYHEGVDDIILDEMDNLRLKIITRIKSKEAKIPVLMATDDGDDILLDIERYDQNPEIPILHGIIPEEVINAVLDNKSMSRREAGAIIGKYFVDLKNVPVRMIESLLEVGRSLPSWPQLGGAAVLSGLYLAYASRRILLGQPINSGRFLMGPEEQLNPEIKTQDYAEKKANLIEKMMGGSPE